MKNRWKATYKIITIVSFLIVSFSFSTVLAEKKKGNVEQKKRIEALDNLDFIEMLNSVDVGSSSSLIQKFQNKEGKNKLLNGKYNPSGECTVEAFRNKEVLLITIPAHLLFSPNSTELMETADEFLNPIKRYLKDPDMYRVLLVMHTDNTGSDIYRDKITVDRVNAVFDWLDERVADTRYLFSYAMGDDMKLVENNSLTNRDKNRRLEIYLVPGTKMVEQASKGRIAF